MFESVVSSLLDKYLGSYIEGIDSKQLDLGLKGDIKLEKLLLKHDAFESMGLPLTIVQGYIRYLRIKAPWTKLKTDPVIVEIDGVYGLIKPSKEQPVDPAAEAVKQQKAKMNKVESAEAIRRANDSEEKKDDQEEGYVRKMVEAAVDNAQIFIKNIHLRYEDDKTVPGSPFALGFTLDTLTMYSTDEQWVQKFRVGQRLVYKLGELKNMSMYWNSFDTPVKTGDIAVFIAEMDVKIPRKPEDAAMHHFILNPLSADLKVTLNKKPDAKKDPNLPKTDVQLKVKAIDLKLENTHVQTLQEIQDVFSLHQQRLKYKDIRPQVPVKGNAKLWWHFAAEPYRVGVRDGQKRASWQYMKRRRDIRREYLVIYKKKMTVTEKKWKKDADCAKLAKFEEELTAEDIIFFRSLAEMSLTKAQAEEASKKRQEQKKKKKKGEIDEDEDNESKQTKKELFDLIDYDPTSPPKKTTFPPEFVVTKVRFSLDSISATFGELKVHHDGRKDIQHILHTNLQTVKVDADLRDGSQFVHFVLGSLCAEDLCSHARKLRPYILDAKKDKDQNFVDLTFEGHPLDHRATHAVKLQVLPVHVTYNNDVISRLIAFGVRKTKKEAPPVEIDTTAMDSQLQNVQTRTWSQLADALETHTTIDLNIDLDAPVIIIPKDPTKVDSDVLVADLGRLCMRSDLNRDLSFSDAQKKMRTSNTKDVEIDAFYDKYVLSLQKVQVFMAKSNSDWNDATNGHLYKTYVVRDFDVNLNVFNSIVPKDITITKTRVEGVLPDLFLAFSLLKYKQIMGIMATIDPMAHARATMPTVVQVVEEEEIPLDDETTPGAKPSVDFGLAAVGVPKASQDKSVSLAKRTMLDARFSLQRMTFVILSEDDSVEVPNFSAHVHQKAITDGSEVAPVEERKSMLLNTVSGSLEQSGTPLLVIALFAVDVHVLQRTFDKDITFILHALLIEDCLQSVGPACAHKYDYLVMSHNPRELHPSLPDIPMPEVKNVTKATDNDDKHLINLNLKMLDARSPYYAKVNKSIGLMMHTAHVNFNRETIAYMISVGQAFAQKPKTDPAVERAANMTREARANSIMSRASFISQARSRRSTTRASNMSGKSTVSKSGGSAPKAPPDDSVTNLKVHLGLNGVSVSMNEVIQGSTVLTALLANVSCDVDMRARAMVAGGRIGMVDVIDETKAGSLGYPYLVKSVAVNKDDAMCQFEFYNHKAGLDVPKGSQPPLPAADFDTRLRLKTSGMHIFFMNRFIMDLKEYFAGLNALKATFANAGAAVAAKSAEKAKDVDTKKRMCLDIHIRSPLIIVPRSTVSKECLVVDLGQLVVSNSISLLPGTVASYKDDLKCMIEHVGVRSGTYNSPNEYGSDKHGLKLLEDSAFRITVVRSLDPAYHDIPQVDLLSSLSDIPVTLHKSQLHLLLLILKENLKEEPVKRPPLPKFRPKVKKIDIEVPRSKSMGPKRVRFDTNTMSRPGTIVGTIAEEPEERAPVPVYDPDAKWKNLMLSFRMQGVSLKLLDDLTPQVPQLTAPGQPALPPAPAALIHFVFDRMETKVVMNNDKSLDVKLVMTSLTMRDVRPYKLTKFPVLLSNEVVEKDGLVSQLVRLSLTKSANKDITLGATIRGPKLLLVPDVLNSLTEFFQVPKVVVTAKAPNIARLVGAEEVALAGPVDAWAIIEADLNEQEGLATEEEDGAVVNLNDEEHSKRVLASTLVDEDQIQLASAKPPPIMKVNVFVDAPLVYLVQDQCDEQSAAVSLHLGDVSLKYDRSPAQVPASEGPSVVSVVNGSADIRLKKLELFTCKMSDISNTLLPILSPVNIKIAANSQYDVWYNLVSLSADEEVEMKPDPVPVAHNADLKFDPFDIKASYSDLTLVAAIVKSVTAKDEAPQTPGTPIRPPKKKKEKTVKPVSKKPSSGPQPRLHVRVLGLSTLDKGQDQVEGNDMSILIIDDSGGRCTPLIFLALRRISGEILGTPVDMNGKFNASISGSAYNNRLTTWEPLMEYWLGTIDIRRCPADQMKAEEDLAKADAPPLPGARVIYSGGLKTRVKLSSADRLEINLSQSILLQLKETAEALKNDFDEQNGNKTMKLDGQVIRKSFAPYMLRNDCGIPIKFVVGKDNEDWISCPVGESVPIEFRRAQKASRTQLSGPTSKDTNTEATRLAVTHVLQIKLDGFDALDRIPVYKVSKNEFLLTPKLGGLTARCLVDVVVEAGAKVAVVRSVVGVRNGTRAPMMMKWIQSWTPEELDKAVTEKLAHVEQGALSAFTNKVTGKGKGKAKDKPTDEKSGLDDLNDDALPDAPADMVTAVRTTSVWESEPFSLAPDTTVNMPLNIVYLGGFMVKPNDEAHDWSPYIKQEQKAVTRTKSGLPILYMSNCPSRALESGVFAAPYRFSIHYGRIDANQISVDPETIISLEPPMVLENVTLLPMQYEIKRESAPDDCYSGTLERSESVDLYSVNMAHRWLMRVRFPSLQYDWSTEVCIHGSGRSKQSRKIYLTCPTNRSVGSAVEGEVQPNKGSKNRVLALDLDYVTYSSGSVCATVYAPFWMCNKSEMPLYYRPSQPKAAGIYCHDASELAQAPPHAMLSPLSPTTPTSPTKNEIDVKDLVSLQMFSYAEFDSTLGSNKLLVATEDSEWTKPCCIDTAGYSGAISLDCAEESASPYFAKFVRQPDMLKNPRNVGCTGEYGLGVSINIAASHFRRTRIVKLEPLYVLCNQTEDYVVCVRQPPPNLLSKSEKQTLAKGGDLLTDDYIKTGTGSPVLAIKDQESWHWPVRHLPKYVQVTVIPREVHDGIPQMVVDGDGRVSGQQYEWSGRISVNDIGDQTIVMKDSEGNIKYFVINVIQRGSQTLVLFSQSEDNRAPYVIQNHTPFPLSFWQCYESGERKDNYSLFKTTGHDTPNTINVPSLGHVNFSWDEPLRSHCIQYVIGDAEIRNSFNIDKLTRYSKKARRTKDNTKKLKSQERRSEDHIPAKLLRRLQLEIVADGPYRVVHLYEAGSAAALAITGSQSHHKTKKRSVRSVDDLMSERGTSSAHGDHSTTDYSQTDDTPGDTGSTGEDAEGEDGAVNDRLRALGVDANASPDMLPSTALELALPGIGLSLVDGAPKEIVYACVNNLRVDVTVNAVITGLEVVLTDVQVLNQLPFAMNQFILSPTKVGKKAKDFFTLSVVKNNVHKEVKYFDYIGVLLQEMDVYVDDPLIQALLGFAQPLMPHNQRLLAAGGGHYANMVVGDFRRRMKEEAACFTHLSVVPHVPIANDNARVYMKALHLNPLKLNLSFQSSVPTDDVDPKAEAAVAVSPVAMYLRTLGVTVAAIDNAPLCLNSLLLEDPFISPHALQSKLTKHYVKQGVTQVYKILGSFDLLGNPVGLLNNIGTGVKDLFYEPYQGAVTSPKEFGLGVARGVSSLLKHTIYGVFNTATKITGTVSKGVATLSMDDEYMKSRERAHQREVPKHLGEGLYYGSKDLAKGVGKGLSGVFTQPMNGAAKGGVGGFFRGLGKGIIGVAVKPAVGVLDFASQTTLGMRNSTTLLDEQKKPTRLPRYIPVTKALVDFAEVDARAQYVLRHVNNGAYKRDALLFNKVLGSDVLLVSNLRVVLLSYPAYEQRWAVPWKYVDRFMRDLTGIVIIIAHQAHKIVGKDVPNQVFVPCLDPNLLVVLYRKISRAYEFYLANTKR